MISMYDSWVKAAENGHIAGIALIDMSAAFDVVDAKILLQKCKLFNFGSDAENWLRSYVTMHLHLWEHLQDPVPGGWSTSGLSARPLPIHPLHL